MRKRRPELVLVFQSRTGDAIAAPGTIESKRPMERKLEATEQALSDVGIALQSCASTIE